MAHFIEPAFPHELLNASQNERLAYFSHKSVAHDAIVKARQLTIDNIEFGTKGAIVPIIGPTGVGTSRLGFNLWRHYQQQGEDEIGKAGAHHSKFTVGAHAPSQFGKINRAYWKRLLTAILTNGGDMLIDNKLYAPSSEFILTHPLPWGDPARFDVETLLQCVVQMLKMRKTKVLFINQANRLFPDGDPGGCSMSQQLLTDLAEQIQTRIVLIGDYGLVRESAKGLDWFHRQLIVHFRRYDIHDDDEHATFVSSIEELLGSMVLPDAQRMRKIELSDAEQIYNRCIGCIGGAKSAFMMAYNHALYTGEAITTEFLLRFMQPVKSARKIAISAMEGEQILSDEDEGQLAKLLEFGLARGAESQASRTFAGTMNTAKSPVSQKRSRIGERKPTRDPVGAVYARRA
jgi:hypothetical protein